LGVSLLFIILILMVIGIVLKLKRSGELLHYSVTF
jgi:hypothetical protein